MVLDCHISDGKEQLWRSLCCLCRSVLVFYLRETTPKIVWQLSHLWLSKSQEEVDGTKRKFYTIPNQSNRFCFWWWLQNLTRLFSMSLSRFWKIHPWSNSVRQSWSRVQIFWSWLLIYLIKFFNWLLLYLIQIFSEFRRSVLENLGWFWQFEIHKKIWWIGKMQCRISCKK